MKLTEQTVLITGATSGIGLALAARLYEMKNTVIISGRKQERLDEIAAHYPRMDTFCCDLQQEDGRVALAGWAINRYPKLNILINNAGLMKVSDFTAEVPFEKIAEEITVNLLTPVHFASLFTEHLQQQENAAVVNVTSGLAYTPLATVPVYCATKAALHSFTYSLRHQLRETSVKVFEIIPPAVATDLGKSDGYEQNRSMAMKLEDFTNDCIHRLENDEYELGIGMAEKLQAEREGLFQMLNPDS
ncbi:hypothetical protein ASG01_00800 [Chryseobacterium sp. Leaf180]|uniref:SDR family oxidoreductase n=1 Tax=Chryseobacterium sp. Leaf180 TaxID=1736289 RepID=UPI0006FD301A|nr:SDR family oxidoreductase [Chryseobacterium sp. Leaf180]KQR94458.1 hypothetical protein ASG01_00800 [Chryseobacterium sp. Leaf180]